MISKCIVLGRGFLGRQFERAGYRVLPRFRFDARRTPLRNLNGYDVIINCIGISDTRFCEDPANFADTFYINAEFPGMLSRYCRLRGKKLVHISTGCLYGDTAVPCTEESPISAHCTYTVMKYAAEKFCDAERDIILRPRLLFGEEAVLTRNNLIQKLATFDRFLKNHNSVTWTQTVVNAAEALVKAGAHGIFNVANNGTYTIYDIAQMLGYEGGIITPEELRREQGVHLVNNVMDISKLEKYYQPADTGVAIRYASEKMKEKVQNEKS